MSGVCHHLLTRNVRPFSGFASTVDGNPMTPEQQAAKLRLCVDVANDVWGGV